nr:MAG TPA: hypothetical protein [Caudoviricetes sp.]
MSPEAIIFWVRIIGGGIVFVWTYFTGICKVIRGKAELYEYVWMWTMCMFWMWIAFKKWQGEKIGTVHRASFRLSA